MELSNRKAALIITRGRARTPSIPSCALAGDCSLYRNLLCAINDRVLRVQFLAILFLFGLGAIGCRQQVFDPEEQLPTYPGISARLEVVEPETESEDLVGGGVTIRQTIRNDSKHRITIYTTPFLQANYVVVREPGGNKAALTPFGRKRRYPRRGDVVSSYIEPGEVEERVYGVDDLFQISEPGEYTVEIATRYAVRDETGAGAYFATDPDPLRFTIPENQSE